MCCVSVCVNTEYILGVDFCGETKTETKTDGTIFAFFRRSFVIHQTNQNAVFRFSHNGYAEMRLFQHHATQKSIKYGYSAHPKSDLIFQNVKH